MSGTISGNHTIVVTLSPATPKVTVTGTINAYGSVGNYMVTGGGGTTLQAVDAALFGAAGTDFTIKNTGLIETHGSAGNLFDAGIVLGQAGSVTNTGSILGATGIAMFGTAGTAFVDNAKLVRGSLGSGVYLQSKGTVENTGTIKGETDGVQLNGGGLVTVAKAGLINGIGVYGVAAGGETTLQNAGSITGLTAGLHLTGGGALTNSLTGHITAPGGTGVELVGTVAGTILNAGTITGQYGVEALATASLYLKNSGAIDGTSFDAVAILAGTASIVNGGTLDGLNGGVVATTGATIDNTGLIEATRTILTTLNGYTFAGLGIDLLGGGYIDNQTVGVINGGQVGVLLEDRSGIGVSLNNAGLIETSNASFVTSTGTFGGLGVYALAGGGITNTGTISGREIGITTKLAPISVNNSGLIEGTGTTFISGANTYAADGVFMADGGTVINNVGGTIIGYGVGVQNAGTGAATVTNSGLIEATGTGYFINQLHRDIPSGAAFNTGGTLTNKAGGRVTGEIGVYGGAGTTTFAAYVDNFGTIAGFGVAGVALGTLAALSNAGQITGASYGVILGAAGRATNQSGGTITGANFGVFGANTGGGSVMVVNDGLIEATGTTFVHGSLTIDTAGISANYGGAVSNQAGGSVAGDIGVVFNAGGPLTNAGTVTGRGGTAVVFNGTQASKLIIDPGAAFNGVVTDGANTGTIELAAGGAGTLAGFSTGFSGFTHLTIDSGANWDFAGASTLSQTVTNNGTINEAGGTLTIAGSLGGAGAIDLGAAPLTLDGSVGATEAIHFSGTGETLALGDAGGFSGEIKSFAVGDTIDLTNIGTAEITKLSFVGGVLTISETSGSVHLTFASPGTFPGDKFVDFKDGAGTAITLASTTAMGAGFPASLPDLSAAYAGSTVDIAHANVPVTFAPAIGGMTLPAAERHPDPVWSVLKLPLG